MKLKELEETVKELVGPRSSYRTYEVKCELQSDHTLEIQFIQEYDYVDITFEQLELISELLGTKNINIGSKEGHPGCDTCDHGSQYILPIYVKQYKLHLEK